MYKSLAQSSSLQQKQFWLCRIFFPCSYLKVCVVTFSGDGDHLYDVSFLDKQEVGGERKGEGEKGEADKKKRIKGLSNSLKIASRVSTYIAQAIAESREHLASKPT